MRRAAVALGVAVAGAAAGCGGHAASPTLGTLRPPASPTLGPPASATLRPPASATLRPPPLVRVQVGALAGDVATGFAVGRGRVLTVAHVLGGRGPGTRVRIDARRSATVLAVDLRDDLALLVAPGVRAARPLSVAGAGALSLLVERAGGVQTLRVRVRRPIVAQVADLQGSGVQVRPALELAATIGAGDSGAPLLSADGRLAGVLFARSDARPGIAYAVDGPAVGRFLSAGQ